MGAQRGSQLTGSASRPAAAGGETSSGRVFWITGLSGAGKTTVGRELWRRLRAAGRSAIFLDGDALREVIAEDLGHSPSNRREVRNAQCAVMPDAFQPGPRRRLPDHFDVPRSAALESRKHPGLSRNLPSCADGRVAASGRQRGSTQRLTEAIYAMSSVLTCRRSFRKQPDLTLDNFGELDSAAAVDRIWTECVMRDGARTAGPAAAVTFGTKAETLETLAPRLRTARILPQVRFSVADWFADRARVLAKIAAERWSSTPVIVRSSAQGEDGPVSSQAGRYDSVLGVLGARDYLGCNRPGRRLLRRERKHERPGFRAAHARACRHGRSGVLAPTERRRPLLHRQL